MKTIRDFLKLAIFLTFVLIFILNWPVKADQKNFSNSSAKEVPEKDGVYDDPEHPGVKVRVFVHRTKPEKPGRLPTPTPKLTCGLDDPQSSAVVSTGPWILPVQWKYNLNPSSVPSSVGSENLAIMAANDFESWSKATGNKIIFTRDKDTNVSRQSLDGINLIAWGRTSSSALAVTYIRYYPENGLVIDIDTIMNRKFPWNWSGGSTNCAYENYYDAEDILTHELGHWIGLGDEYDNLYANNTMYGYGSMTETKKISLTHGDEEAAYSIYNH
ncbi:MAG: hypothetical protein QHH09_01865 [Microgenomates group bacterium]|nr:hypothetical protein [Microgenomates group bacterium]